MTGAASPTSVACPKSMEYGPCGGVTLDGRCEVAEHPCVFLDEATVRWRGPEPEWDVPRIASAERMRALLADRPVVVADFPARALDRPSLERCSDALAGRVDAVLVGDSGSSRVQFPPAYRAHLIRSRGLGVWTGLNARDRNRVALEGELAALADVGVSGVHCVTGDHTLTGDRPDALPVFDLDSTRMASLARRAGHLVSVAETPATPPADRRAERLAEKARAGADVCFVDHCGGVEPVRRFIGEARGLAVETAFVVCVPMVVDAGSAALLRSFTSLVLPDGFLDGILHAADPRAAGLDAVTELCEALLAVDGVSGVDLSGGPARGQAGSGLEEAFADAMGTVADRLGLVE